MFQDKVIVITGGAGGIGKSIREEFEKEGASVCIIDTAENPYFVGDVGEEAVLRRFAEKVLKYLWDDAFKLGRKELFNDCSQGLSAVIEAYEDAAKAKIEKQSAEDPLKKVLVPEVYNEMQKKMAEMAAEQAKTAEEKTSEEEAAESAAEDNPAQEPAGEE